MTLYAIPVRCPATGLTGLRAPMPGLPPTCRDRRRAGVRRWRRADQNHLPQLIFHMRQTRPNGRSPYGLSLAFPLISAANGGSKLLIFVLSAITVMTFLVIVRRSPPGLSKRRFVVGEVIIGDRQCRGRHCGPRRDRNPIAQRGRPRPNRGGRRLRPNAMITNIRMPHGTEGSKPQKRSARSSGSLAGHRSAQVQRPSMTIDGADPEVPG